MNIGGRPVVYKQGPGDSPEEQKQAVPLGGNADGSGSRSTASTAQPSGQPRVLSGSVGERNSAPATSNTTVIAQNTAPMAVTSPNVANPTGYTQAARYGDMLFLSGIIPLDASGQLAGKNIEEQTRQAMDNVRAVLESNRLTMANLVSVTVYLSSINDLGGMDRVYATFFRSNLPARSVVEVQRLPRGALIEVSAIAGR